MIVLLGAVSESLAIMVLHLKSMTRTSSTTAVVVPSWREAIAKIVASLSRVLSWWSSNHVAFRDRRSSVASVFFGGVLAYLWRILSSGTKSCHINRNSCSLAMPLPKTAYSCSSFCRLHQMLLEGRNRNSDVVCLNQIGFLSWILSSGEDLLLPSERRALFCECPIIFLEGLTPTKDPLPWYVVSSILGRKNLLHGNPFFLLERPTL